MHSPSMAAGEGLCSSTWGVSQLIGMHMGCLPCAIVLEGCVPEADTPASAPRGSCCCTSSGVGSRPQLESNVHRNFCCCSLPFVFAPSPLWSLVAESDFRSPGARGLRGRALDGSLPWLVARLAWMLWLLAWIASVIACVTRGVPRHRPSIVTGTGFARLELALRGPLKSDEEDGGGAAALALPTALVASTTAEVTSARLGFSVSGTTGMQPFMLAMPTRPKRAAVGPTSPALAGGMPFA